MSNETLYEEIEENEVEEDLSQVAEIIKGFNDSGIHFDRAVAFVRDTIFQSFRYHPMYMGYAYKPIGDMVGNMAMTRLVAALKKVFSSNELVAVNGKLSLSIEKRSLVMGETLIPVVRDEKTMDFILKNINLRTITVDGEIEVHSVFDIQQDSNKVMRLHPEDIDAYLNFVIGTNTELIMNVAGQALGGVSVEKLKSERNLGKSNFKDNDARSDSSISVAERYGKLPELFLSTIRDVSGTKRVNTIAVKDLLIRIAQALPLNYGGRSSIEMVFETMSKHYGFFFKGQKLNESLSKEDLLDIARTLYGLDVIDKKTFENIRRTGLKDYDLLHNAIEAINSDPTWESFRLTYDTMFNPNALTHYGLAKHLLPLFESMQYYAIQMTTQESYDEHKENYITAYKNLKAAFERIVQETYATRIDFVKSNETEANKLVEFFRGMIISLDLEQRFGINPALDTDLKAFEFRAKRIKEFIESIENQRSMVTTVVSATQSGKRTGLINSYIRGLADRAERLSTKTSVIFSGKQGHTVNTMKDAFLNRFSISKLNSFPKEHERLMEALTLNNSGNSNFSWEFDTFKEGEHKGKAYSITIKAGEKGKPKSFVLLKITYDLGSLNPIMISAGPELRDEHNTYQSRMRSLGRLLFNNVSFKKAFNERSSKAEELIGLTVLQHIMALEFAHGTMKDAELLFSLFKNATYGGHANRTEYFSFTTVGYNKVPTGVHPSYIAGAVTNIFQNSRVTLTQKNRSATNKTILDLTRRNNSFFNNIEDALNSFDKVWQTALKKTVFFGQGPLQLLEMYIDGGVKATGAIDKRVMQANDMQTHHLLLFIERLKAQRVICVPEMPQSVRKDTKLVEVREAETSSMFAVHEDSGGIAIRFDYKDIYSKVLETLEAYDAISRISLDNLLTVLTKALNEKNGTALVYRPNKERATADLRNDAKNLFEQLKRVWKDVTQEDLYALGLNPEDAKIYRSEKTKEVYMELGRDADYKFLANDKVITKENLQLLRENELKKDENDYYFEQRNKERIIDDIFRPHYRAMAENKSSTYDKVIQGNYRNHKLNSYGYTKGGKEYEYDDLIKAQALAYFIVNANLTPFIMGSVSGFKDSASLGKRAMAHSQPYSAIIPLENGAKDYMNINKRYTEKGAKVIVFKDSETKGFLFDPIFGNHSDFSIADYDGAIWINPLLADHIYDGSGGSYGQADKNALLKLALSQANMPMKGLIMPITHESLLYSPMQRRMLMLMLNPGNSEFGQSNGIDVVDSDGNKVQNAHSYFEEKYAEYLAIGNTKKDAFDKAIKETGKHVAYYDLDMADILSPDGSVKKDMRMASQESFQEMLVNGKPATNFMLPFNVNKTGVNTNFSSTPDSVEADTTAFQQLLNILVGTNTDTKKSNAFLFDQAEQMEAARNSLIQKIFPEGDMAMLYRGMREGDPATINRIVEGLNAIAATSNDLGYMVNAGLTMATAEKATKTFQLANKRMQRIVKPNLAGLRTADRAFNEKEIVEVTFVSNGNEIKEVFVNQEYAQRFIATLPEAIRETAVVSPARMLNHSFPQLTEEGRERVIELISASGIYDQKTIDLLSAIYGNDGNAIAKFLEYPDRLVQEISDNEIAKEIAEKLLNTYGDICKKLYKIDGKRGKLMQYHVGESIGASVMASKYHVPADMSMAELFYLVKEDSVESLSTASYKDEAINEHPWFKAFIANEKLKADDNGRKKFLEAVRIVDMSRESVSVRTPSTNAHSGVMTKNIFFLHDSGMVTLYSPLDMFARGSDQDGDQSSHYHRLPKGIQIGKINADESNKYVDMAFDYYNNPNHFPYIFKPINTDAFVKEAKKSIPNDRYFPFSSATGSQLINSATAGAKGIGIYAIFQKAFTFMLQAYNGDVATYFKEAGIYYNKPEQIAAALAFIGDVGNALVDNTKHGIAGTVNMFDEFIPAIMASFNDPNFMQRIQEAGLYQYKDGLSEYENRIKATVAFLTSPQFNEIANSRKSFYENGRKDTIELGEMALFKASNNTGKIDTVTDSYIIDNNTGLQLSKYVKKPEVKEEVNNVSNQKVSEIFESNPELAYSIYEYLGFNEINLEDKTIKNISVNYNEKDFEKAKARASTDIVRDLRNSIIGLYDGKSIFIDNKLSSEEKERVVKHEIAHLIYNNVAYKIHHLVKNINSKIEKDLTDNYYEPLKKERKSKGLGLNFEIDELDLFIKDDPELSLKVKIINENISGEEFIADFFSRKEHRDFYLTNYKDEVIQILKLINHITPEQKQQAQQLYSQYLNTTPDNEVKNFEGFKKWKQKTLNSKANQEAEDASFDKVKTKGFDKKLAKQLKTILQELYPKIKLRIEETNNDKVIGQADIKAKTVLIDAVNQKQDTLPHEYAHHYIAMFRDTEIVQEAIKQWGSEEALVQAIGEQAVKQKGKAWSWWNKFVNWILSNADVSALEKEDIKNILTDAFLTNQNLKAKSYDEIKQPLTLLQLSDKIYNDPTIAQNDKQKAFDEAINNDYDLQEEVDALMETVKDQFNNKNKKRLKREDTGLLLLNHVVAKLNEEKTASDLESGGLNAYQQTLMDQVQSFTNSYATILSTIYKNKNEVKQKVEAVKKALEEAIIKKEPIDEAIKKFSLNRFTKAENTKKKKMLNNLFAGSGKQLKEAFNKYADANELTDEQRVELYFLMRTADLETIEDKLNIESDYVDDGNDDQDLETIALMTAVKDKKEVDAFYSEVKKQIWKMKKTLSAMKSLSLRNSYGWNTINQMLLEYAINGKSIMNFATFANLNQFDFNSPFAMFRFKNEVKANHGMEYDDFAQLFLGTAEEGKAKLPPFSQRVQNMVEKPEPATFKYLKDGAEVEETLDFNSAVANKVDWIAFVLDHPSLFEMVKSFVMLEALSKARMEGSVAARETIEYVRTIQQAGGKKNLSEKDYIEITKVIQDYYYAKFLQNYIGENKEEVNALLNNGIIFENGRAKVNPISNGSPLLDNFYINLPIDLSTPQGIYLFVTNAPTYIYEVIQEYKANNSDNPAVIYNAFIQDLAIDQSGMRDKLVLNDVKEGSSEDAAYRIGMTNLPEPIKNLIKLYMLADGGLGYSKGFSRYMPIEFKMEADAFIKEMMASTDRSIAQEMIAYFEDRIAGSPESFLYENTKSAPNTANKVYLVKEKDANGKMNIESDLIYRNSNGQLMKLPFGNFAMTVIPGRTNSVPISLEDQRIGDNIPIEELLSESHSFTFEGIAYESIADFFSRDYNSKKIKDNDFIEDVIEAMLRENIGLLKILINYSSVAYKSNKDVPRYYQQIANAINTVDRNGRIADLYHKHKIRSTTKYDVVRKSLIFPVLNYEIIKKNFIAKEDSDDNSIVKLDNISKTQEMIYTPGSIITFLDGTVGTVISAGKGSLTYEVTEKGELYDGASLNMGKMKKAKTNIQQKF